MRDWRSALLAAPIGLGLGWLVPVLPGLVAGLAVGSVQIGFVAFAVALAARGAVLCVTGLRNTGHLTHVATLTASVGTLIAVALPGAQLLAGSRVSKLAELGRPPADVSSDVLRSYGLFVVALLALAIGKEFANSDFASGLRAHASRRRPRLDPAVLNSRGVYFALLAFGVAAYAVHPSRVSQDSLALRGTVKGQGITQLMGYGPALAAAFGLMRRHWGSRVLCGVSLVAVGSGIVIG